MPSTAEINASIRREFLASNPGERILDGESIVISGISGLYAQAHNVKELASILYNKVCKDFLNCLQIVYQIGFGSCFWENCGMSHSAW